MSAPIILDISSMALVGKMLLCVWSVRVEVCVCVCVCVCACVEYESGRVCECE